MKDRQLDVRKVPPNERHTAVFGAFDALTVGAALELITDHDPKPLFFQFSTKRSGAFEWDYRERGPEVWRILLRKKSSEIQTDEEEGCCGICGGENQ